MEGGKGVRDVHDRRFRIDFQDDALQRPPQVVIQSVIRSEGNNRVGQCKLPKVVSAGRRKKMRAALRPLTLANAPCPVKTTRGCLLCNPPPPNLPPSGRPASVVVPQHAAPVEPFARFTAIASAL